MKRAVLLGRILYREFVVYNLIFTAAAIPWLVLYGPGSYMAIIWIKLIGFALAATFYWIFCSNRLLFFYNLHLNRQQLLAIALVMDAVQTFLVLFFINFFLP
uniref:Uncharacterized protein n=1 Tax=Roseihalotalea indica TaxID=2867963 RepID=A0AA49JHT5_9BACT|nr:hypothetical protein K4G66_12990 [Tunicatimonas sp. TK19036]